MFRCRILYVLSNAWADLRIVRNNSYFIPHKSKSGSCLFCVFWLFSHYHKTYTIMGHCVVRSHPFSPTDLKCTYLVASAPGRKGRWISEKSPDLEWASAASKVPPWRWNIINTVALPNYKVNFLETPIKPYASSSLLLNMQESTPISQESPFAPSCAIQGFCACNKVFSYISLICVKFDHLLPLTVSKRCSINKGQKTCKNIRGKKHTE